MTRTSPPAPDPEWAYFLDFDGTLVDLAPSPGEVALARTTVELLRALHQRCGGAAAVVSGRALADLDALIGLPDLPAVGQHGLERREPDTASPPPADSAPALEAARVRLRRFVARHPALVLEDKGRSIALHYRAAPKLAGVVHRVVNALRQELGDGLTVQRGKRIVELRPAGFDKGCAVAALLEEPPFRGRRPVFIGDDLTDEPAFELVNAIDGISIKVGRGASVARWRLNDPAAVTAWLARAIPQPGGVRS